MGTRYGLQKLGQDYGQITQAAPAATLSQVQRISRRAWCLGISKKNGVGDNLKGLVGVRPFARQRNGLSYLLPAVSEIVSGAFSVLWHAGKVRFRPKTDLAENKKGLL